MHNLFLAVEPRRDGVTKTKTHYPEKVKTMDSTSNQAGIKTSQSPATSSIISSLTTSNNLLSADDTLKSYVDEMLHLDKRFKGMSRYVVDINFYWSMAIPTACAGHGFIFFNPEWWDKLHHEERKTVIAHEIWHLVLNHLERGKDKDPEDYNIAGDHVINLACEQDGFVTTLSPGGAPTNFGDMGMVIDRQFIGMGTDAIYSKVHADRKKDPKSHQSAAGSPSPDQIEDLVQQALQGTGTDLTQQIRENAEKADEAMESAGRDPGNQPGGTNRVLQTEGQKVFIHKASYEEIFEPYLIDPLSGGKRTYMRPSRRQVAGGLKLKGKYPKRGRKNRLTHLVYALDVSGSITSYQAQQFLRSAKTLKEVLNPQLMTVMLWDTAIKFEKTFREDEKLDGISVVAGGGTSLHPVYKRVKEINPEALVIFTDLAVDIPPKPDWETIWFVPDSNVYAPYLNAVKYGKIYLVPEK